MLFSVQILGQELPNWAKTDSRTQGGGWQFYPGKFSHKDRIVAGTMAKGRALEYVMLECGLAHKEIRFNEVLERKVNGIWEVYVRASLTYKQCKEAKYGSFKLKVLITSQMLNKIYWAYKNFNANLKVDTDLCPASDPTLCLEIADEEWKLGNTFKAMYYAKRGCQLGYDYLCGFNGFMLWELGYVKPARAYLHKSCVAGNKQHCNLQKKVEEDTKRYLASN